MIITCPDCGKRYNADEKAFSPSGRKVKCANCGFVWFQESARESDDHAIEAHDGFDDDSVGHGTGHDVEHRHEFDDEEPSPQAARSGLSAARVAGWALLLLIMGGATASAYQYRHFIVKAWPQTVTAYRVLGIDTNVTGIALKDIATERNMEDGLPILSVRGRVVNLTNRAVPVPRVRLSLVDSTGEEVYWWFHALPLGRLDPQEDYRFVSNLHSPPVGATHLKVEFDQNDETISGL